MDYDFATASSDRLDWYEKQRAKKGETTYRTVVTVHRKGDFIFPVDVLIKFDNGDSVREHWDGRDRWVRYTYDKKAKLLSAEVDPEHMVRLDKDAFNNSYTAQPDARASRKITRYWMVFIQFLSQIAAWLA